MVPPNTALHMAMAGYSSSQQVTPPVRKPMASLPWVTSMDSSTMLGSGPAWSRTSQSGQIRPSFTGRADSASFRARATRSSSAEPQ